MAAEGYPAGTRNTGLADHWLMAAFSCLSYRGLMELKLNFF
jgi:hypothetical protein